MNAENGFSNALGRLVERRNGASFIRSTYDGDEVVFDDNNGTSFWYYANGPGIDNKLWFWPGQPMPVYVLKDHLGSTRGLLTTINGQFLGPYNYDSFGKPLGTLPMRFAYAGREYDSDTELYYYRARWYDPQARRFISEDPIGLNGGINLYAYTGNNPINYTDPSGQDAIYINYDYYPVSTPVGKLPLGHGAVVAVDPATGVTKYYEFGRYDAQNRGIVRGAPNIKIPNLKIGEDGHPTQESLDYLYNYLSKHYGKNSKVTATYYRDSDFRAVIKFAEEFRKNHPVYDLLSNNCKTFGKAAATAKSCKKEEKCK